MSGFEREELEAMVDKWLEANRVAEESGDWRSMVDCYADDAHYGWNYGPEVDFMADGKDQIRDWAIGLEMDGLAGWTYPYESIIIDDKKGMVIGLWRQVADAKREDGSDYQIAGIGGSWFKYAGNMQWAWQRDWFDLGNVVNLFFELIAVDKLSEGMQGRMKRPLGPPTEGHYKLGTAPRPIWPEDR